MTQETVTRTFSVQISDETFQLFKSLERETGIPREHLVTAMVTILADKNSKVVNEVVMLAHNHQLDVLQAKMKNGGFFHQPTQDIPKSNDGKSENNPVKPIVDTKPLK